jgi:hypothetical protein
MVGHGPEAIPARGDGGGGVGAPPLLLAQLAATVLPRCGHHAAMEGGQALRRQSPPWRPEAARRWRPSARWRWSKALHP